MRRNKKFHACAIAGITGLAAIGLAPSAAEAASCGTSSGLDTTQVQLTGSNPDLGGYPISANECAGLFTGNEVGQGGAGLLAELNGNDAFAGYTLDNWVYIGESNSALVAFAGDGTGTFSLDFSPDSYDVFALSLFGGNSWGVWLFDLTTAILSANGTYSMSGFLNRGGQVPDLSHIGVAAYSSNSLTVIPLPATLPLFLTGLLGMGLLARRRRQTAEV